MSESTAYRTPHSDRGAKFFVHPVEDPVDESARILRAELLGDLDGLVDRDLRRHLPRPQELEGGETEDVAIDDGHPLQIPMFGELGEHLVNLGLVGLSPAHQGVGERSGVGVHGVSLPEFGAVPRGIGLAVQVELVKELESDLARLPALAHLSSAGRTARIHFIERLQNGLNRGWPERDACGSDPPVQPRYGYFDFCRFSLGGSGSSRPCAVPPRRLPHLGCRRRRQRELERAWDPMELDSVFAEPRRLERFPGAADQALGDALVETRRDDREPGRCGTYRCPAELGSATGHLSPEVTTTGARACRAW